MVIVGEIVPGRVGRDTPKDLILFIAKGRRANDFILQIF